MADASELKTVLEPSRVAEMLEQGEAELIDVRDDDEWEAGHIHGARHVELADLTAEAGSIDRDRTVIFHCRGDGRSGMATDAFREAGYDAYTMEGGIVAWADTGLPLEPEDGEVISRRPPEAH
jgi:rhodanese-related sulfurtransferase